MAVIRQCEYTSRNFEIYVKYFGVQKLLTLHCGYVVHVAEPREVCLVSGTPIEEYRLFTEEHRMHLGAVRCKGALATRMDTNVLYNGMPLYRAQKIRPGK